MEQKQNNSNSDSSIADNIENSRTNNNIWRSKCCDHNSKVNKRLLMFINKSIVGLIAMVWSIYMISTNPDDDNTIYWIILSSVVSGSSPDILEFKR